MRIILQFPEGLKAKALEEAAKLEKEGHEVFVSCSPCYGACDLCLEEARLVKADRIMHFGHGEFMKVKNEFEIEYVPYFAELDRKKAGKAISKGIGMLREIGAKKVSLVFPIQHLHNSKIAREGLEKAGISVLLAKGGEHTRHAGQVLGCDAKAAEIEGADAFVYFGGGKFHPLAIATSKPVLCIDPHLGDSYWITDDIKRAERKRTMAIVAASQAKVFGILISSKCGQQNLSGARIAKKAVEKKGRKAMLLVANELSPLSLSNFMSFDAYINTACPRINDDTEAYGKPVVDIRDLKRLLELM